MNNTTIYKQLGLNIKQERLKNNLTQDQLSEKLDIYTSYLGRIERGERNVPLSTLIKIANLLDVSIDYLLKDSTAKDNSNAISLEFNNLTADLSTSEKILILEMIKLMTSHFKNK